MVDQTLIGRIREILLNADSDATAEYLLGIIDDALKVIAGGKSYLLGECDKSSEIPVDANALKREVRENLYETKSLGMKEQRLAYDVVDFVLARFPKREAVAIWRDGSTAPKDGTKFLAYTGLNDYEVCEWVETKRYSYEDAGNGLFKRVETIGGYWNNNTPVKWMPINSIEGQS